MFEAFSSEPAQKYWNLIRPPVRSSTSLAQNFTPSPLRSASGEGVASLKVRLVPLAAGLASALPAGLAAALAAGETLAAGLAALAGGADGLAGDAPPPQADAR